MERVLALIITTLSIYQSFGQLLPYQHHTERMRDKSDTNTLQHFFRNGDFFGHARYYFMATDNTGPLKDFFANAFGMGIGYETGKFHGFQIGISGFFIYNLYSSDFTKPDPITGLGSRYEVGQFDMLNPNNHHDMDRLEDLYIKYSLSKSNIKFGKQHIKTPFINPQDGRMRPTLVEGAMFELEEIKNIKLEGGWLFGISPRSTVNWFGIGESIGIFPAGVDTDGKRSKYPGNVKSDAVYYGGLTYQPSKKLKLQIWNMHIDNVLNSSLLQYNGEYPILSDNRLNFLTGLQYIEQHAAGNGGNDDLKLAYVHPDNKARTFGARLGIGSNGHWSMVFNYNRITNDGRYLMPREWGRDPFFTFMARERNEGYANAHAGNVVFTKTFGKSGWKSEIAYGQFHLPDISDTRANKYAMPSYWQTNADIRYVFSGFLSGLELQLLYIYKGKMGNAYNEYRNIINKVDMSLYNVVINYHF
jgi:hypothetical protein